MDNQGVKKSRGALLSIFCINVSGILASTLNLLDPTTLRLYQLAITVVLKAGGCQVDLVECLCISVECKAACTDPHRYEEAKHTCNNFRKKIKDYKNENIKIYISYPIILKNMHGLVSLEE